MQKKAVLFSLLMTLYVHSFAQINFTYDISGNLTLTQQTEKPPPEPVISTINDSTLSSTQANYYQWYFNNKEVINDTTQTIKFDKVGIYKVGVSPNRDCWSYSKNYPVVAINAALPDTLTLNIYPNPSRGQFTVDVKLQRATGVITYITVFNETGVAVLQTQRLIFFTNEVKIPMSLSIKGTYNVRLFINGSFKTVTLLIM